MLNDALFHARVRLENALVKRANSLPRGLLYRLAGGKPESSGERTLDAEMQVIAFSERQMRPLHTYPRSEMRARYEYVSQMMSPVQAPPVMTTRRRIYLASERGGQRELALRIYTPERGPFPKPVLVYFHGGGWCIGSAKSHEPFCQLLADQTDMIVVSIDYRLAPEHPFPLPIEDAIDSWQWVVDHIGEFAGRADRILVGGDSAGGNLAAVVCQQARERGYTAPHGQVLIYPATDQRRSHESHTEMGKGYVLTGDLMGWFVRSYLGDMSHAQQALASPLLATPEQLRGLPPAIVTTCGFDPLRDEGTEYARAMAAQGVAVDYHEFTHLLHGFIGMTGVSSQAMAGAKTMCEQIRALLARLDGIHS